MQIQQVLALVATLLLSGALAAAPGDESSVCQWSDPETQMVLMDSNRYSNLIQTRETERVWREFDVDGGNSWVYSTGGQCARQVESCNYFEGTQNNWLFTQHILKRIPASNYQTRVYVEVSYSGLFCSSTVDAKVFYKIENTASDQTTNNRYLQYTSQLMGLPCGGSPPVLSSFVLSEGQDGFYIAIQDPGACVTIRRLVVYRKRCPSRQVGLVLYPEAPAPLTDVSVEANCVSNAAGTGLTLTCNSEGVWSGTPQCECSPGYRREGNNCTACPPGTYRGSTDSASSCLICTANTITTEPNADICQCKDGFYRTADETAANGCSSPPSAVHNEMVPITTSTTVTLTWERATSDRNDVSYAVSFSDPISGEYISYDDNIEDNGSPVTVTVTGLMPYTLYSFRITASNGVSDMDPTRAALREVEITATTTEGLPEPPVDIRGLCIVVLWQKPNRPNGIITGYDVIFLREAMSQSVNPIRKNHTSFFHIVEGSDLPGGSGDFLFMVRAITSVGEGSWSDAMSTNCNGTTPTDCDDPPAKIEQVSVQSTVVLWERPETECLSGFELKIYRTESQTDMRPFFVNNPNQHWFNITEDILPRDQRPASIEVRGLSFIGSGQWSDPTVIPAIIDESTDTKGAGGVDITIGGIVLAAAVVGTALLSICLMVLIVCIFVKCKTHHYNMLKRRDTAKTSFDLQSK